MRPWIPLSDVLSLLKISQLRRRRVRIDGRRLFDPVPQAHDGIKCYAVVVRARVGFAVDGVAETRCGSASRATVSCCRVGTALSIWPPDLALDAGRLHDLDGWARPTAAESRSADGGRHLLFRRRSFRPGRAITPEILVERAATRLSTSAREADKAALRWSVDQHDDRNCATPSQGGVLMVVQHLAQMLLVQALRAHLSEGVRRAASAGCSPWPTSRWAPRSTPCTPIRRTALDACRILAERAGMSRSTFAAESSRKRSGRRRWTILRDGGCCWRATG